MYGIENINLTETRQLSFQSSQFIIEKSSSFQENLFKKQKAKQMKMLLLENMDLI